MSIQLAGGDGSHSILSILDAEHSNGRGLFQYFSTEESTILRKVCKEFRHYVTIFPWHDSTTPIKSNLKSWRKSFPKACAANISEFRYKITDNDFINFHKLSYFSRFL